MSDTTRQIPEDFHALYDPGARAARGVAPPSPRPLPTEGGERLNESVAALSVDYDEATQLPNRVSSSRPEVVLSTRSATSPEQAVGRFVEDHGDLWNLSPADVSAVEVVSVSGQRLTTVHLIQRVNGAEVFNSDVTAAVGPADQVLSVAGQFFPGAAAAESSDRAATISPEEAIACAALDLTGVEYDSSAFVRQNEPQDDPYRFYGFEDSPGEDRPAFERPARVKDVLFPLGEEQFVPGYYLELWVTGLPAFAYVIDSEGQPDVLFRKNLVADVAFRYNVFNTGDGLLRPEDGPAPGTPHPTGTPNGFQAATIAERPTAVESLLPGDPWLPAGATTTSGNNCIAYADLRNPNGASAGDVLGKTTSPNTFDYTYVHAKPAEDPTNLQSSLVGMFFHVNWLHDRWYRAGFDEAAGNAQQNKFGRGGIGGDPILAEGNDFSGTDNANMATPPAGSSPRMQMFIFEGVAPLPTRTSNFEALVTFHEMGHYITNRLVGNATGLSNQQGKAMGEGWGDFFAICMTSQAGDDFGGTFAVGGWTDLTPTFTDNYYFSIRRYPYTTDIAKNPLTFKHISNGVILPAGAPRNPNSGGSNSAVHNAGEIWCTALWEVFVNLVARHGHEEAERRMLEYVVGGLKLTPNAPTFTQARDGVVSAASALEPGDLGAVWDGFAKRGMGVDAISPPSSSTTLAGVVESFGTP